MNRFLRLVALYGGAFVGAVIGAILAPALLKETGGPVYGGITGVAIASAVLLWQDSRERSTKKSRSASPPWHEAPR